MDNRRSLDQLEDKKKQSTKTIKDYLTAAWENCPNLLQVATKPLPICDSDQCFLTNVHPTGSTLLTAPETIFSQKSLSDVLPEDFLSAMQEAAKTGFLYTFFCTLSNEFVTDRLRSRNYNESQIDNINQVIKALTLLSLGASCLSSCGTPLTAFVLTKYVGFKREEANYLTAATMVAVSTMLSPATMTTTALSLLTAIATSAVTSAATRSLYRQTASLLKMGAFKREKIPQAAVTQEEGKYTFRNASI